MKFIVSFQVSSDLAFDNWYLSYPLLVKQSTKSFCLRSFMLKIKIDFEQDFYCKIARSCRFSEPNVNMNLN